MSDVRRAHCVRTTKETDIDLTFTIDGSGKSMISTDIGFFDHMLEGFARHGCKDQGRPDRGLPPYDRRLWHCSG